LSVIGQYCAMDDDGQSIKEAIEALRICRITLAQTLTGLVLSRDIDDAYNKATVALEKITGKRLR
jgi:hypothetical protein